MSPILSCSLFALLCYIPFMIRKKVTIKNSSGLHARPSAALVKIASSFSSDFFIHMYGYRVNGKSILGVMTLAAECGAEMELEVDGSDEKECLAAIEQLIEDKFGMKDE